MKTTSQPGDQSSKQSKTTSKKGANAATNPKKPGNDPDQTPEREVENIPKAKSSPAKKSQIGFKK